MKTRLILVLFALAGLTPTLISWGASVLAKVNGKVITLEEFEEKLKKNAQFFVGQNPSKKNVLEDLITREVGIQEAKKLGLHKDPEVIDRMETVLYHALLEKNLAKEFEKINISDKEAQAYYNRNPEIRTSHIFVRFNPADGANAEKEAYQKILSIRNTHLKNANMSFAEVAQKYSEGVEAPLGGDLDYQTRDRLDPAYYEAALKLKTPGRVSDIVKTRFGYHIIKLTAVRDWKDVDRPKIKRIVFEQERQKLFDRYMAGLKKKAQITVNFDLIKE